MNQDRIDPAELPPSILSPFVHMVYIIQKAKVHMDKKNCGLDYTLFIKNSDLMMCVAFLVFFQQQVTDHLRQGDFCT